ncbi:MAG: extracellular solute-binding protein, partial [Azonexus sp.]|nr:extracellular solute-binding protein [Azonexus sp.]
MKLSACLLAVFCAAFNLPAQAAPAKPAAKSTAKPAAKAAPKPAAPLALELAHNLGPEAEQRLQEVLERFNKESGLAMSLKPFVKGGKPAVLNLMRRDETGEVLRQAKQFTPLYKVMASSGVKFNAKDISPDLKAGVVDGSGRLVALPLVYSTPVLFYNKNAFRKAGLDPEQPPATWFEMQGMLDKLQSAGSNCP